MNAEPRLSRPVLFFDGGCKVCRAAARLLLALDRRGALSLVPFADPLRFTLLSALDDDALAKSMHVVGTDGAVVSGGDAFLAVLLVLPAPLGSIGRLAGRSERLAGLLRRSYWFVVRNRPAIGRWVPDVAAVRRL